MKIVAISDNHGVLPDFLPSGDILCISGDVCPNRGSHHPVGQGYWIKGHFLPYLDSLIKSGKFKDVVFIFGNHDFIGESILVSGEGIFRKELPDHVHYLRDSEVVIDGIKIYGSPWVSNLPNWAFNAREEVLQNKYANIPEGLDILLSHAPVYGYNDKILKPIDDYQKELGHLGNKALYDHVKRAKPHYIFVAHIHSGNHKEERIIHDWNDLSNCSKSYNVSILDESYQIAYDPLVIDI